MVVADDTDAPKGLELCFGLSVAAGEESKQDPKFRESTPALKAVCLAAAAAPNAEEFAKGDEVRDAPPNALVACCVAITHELTSSSRMTSSNGATFCSGVGFLDSFNNESRADCNAVLPLRVLMVLSAPDSRRNRTLATFPLEAAYISGVTPVSVVASTG